MGAFFLAAKDADWDRPAVETVFARKGFAAPAVFDLGTHELLLYRKQLVDVSNHVSDDRGNQLFAVGTPVYQAKGYRDSLEALFADSANGRLDHEALLGNYCLLFHRNDTLTLRTDPLGVQQVFHTTDGGCISSSFLATMAALPGRASINHPAFREEIAGGYILPPDTVVEEVRCLVPGRSSPLRLGTVDVPACPLPEADEPQPTFDACVDKQIAVLTDYFRAVAPLVSQYGADAGISGGYDSRLIVALCGFLDGDIGLHTHATRGQHESERAVATELARLRGYPLVAVETASVEKHRPEDLGTLLEDNLYYFDARNADNMGAFHETYTRAYRKAVLGKYGLGFGGMGGEMYRNYYRTARSTFDCRAWMEHHRYHRMAAPGLRSAGGLGAVHDRVCEKLGNRLGIDFTGRITFAQMRAYYSLVRMPDCDGRNNNAHNQLSFYLTPFIEPRTVRAGLAATPFIGLGGRLEAAMIRKLDPQLAAVNSHYGFPFTSEPPKYRLYCALKGYLPDPFWTAWNRFGIRHRAVGKRYLARYRKTCEVSEQVREADRLLRRLEPELDWETVTMENAGQMTTAYMGQFLREFQDKLTW